MVGAGTAYASLSLRGDVHHSVGSVWGAGPRGQSSRLCRTVTRLLRVPRALIFSMTAVSGDSRLAGGEDEGQRPTPPVGDEMDLAGQPAPRTPGFSRLQAGP